MSDCKIAIREIFGEEMFSGIRDRIYQADRSSAILLYAYASSTPKWELTKNFISAFVAPTSLFESCKSVGMKMATDFLATQKTLG